MNRPSYLLAGVKDQRKVSQFEHFFHLLQRMMKVPKVHWIQIIYFEIEPSHFPTVGTVISCFQISLDEISW